MLAYNLLIFKIYLVDEGVTKSFFCARELTGQYVFLQLVGVEGSLSLCEVEVFTANGKLKTNLFTHFSNSLLGLKQILRYNY